ncbi:MAG: AmmeMemoRadiSam system protein B [Patescibacteria group bacterium]
MRNNLIVSVLIGLAITLGVVWLVFLFNGGGEGLVSHIITLQRGASIIRMPAVAGAFYPDAKEELSAQIDYLLTQASTTPISEHIRIMIVPHAGYEYSGAVAASAYRALSANRAGVRSVPTIILIGSGHKVSVEGAAFDSHDAWQTPLGKIPVNKELRDMLVRQSTLFHLDAAAHKDEHSLEVQLPFLQKTFVQFEIVPLLVNKATEEEQNRISAALASLPGDIILIASTDLSHYPIYEDATAADTKVIESLLSGNAEQMKRSIAQLETQHIREAVTFMCAQPAVEIALKVAQLWGADERRLLKYANSGDSFVGDKSRVVGYAAMTFTSARKDSELLPIEQEQLLRIARTSVESYVNTQVIPQVQDDSFFLNQERGAFVTIKKNDTLRGCIGQFNPDAPLYQLVSQMAIAAAVEDHRFLPINQGELGELTYEISILSPLRKIKDWREIEIGKHGVRVRKGSREGIFLPQVATENNWGLGEFMGELCSQKVGMASDCWKDPHAELYIFTAQVFGE